MIRLVELDDAKSVPHILSEHWGEPFASGRPEPLVSVKYSDSESFDSDNDITSLISSVALDESNSVPLTAPTTQTTHDSDVSLSKDNATDVPEKIFDSFIYRSQESYLQFMEPSPVYPPHYSTLPPGGCPRYPVLESVHQSDSLPPYSPAAYKIGMVAKKAEWLSPFQPASSRSWKNIIIELNSTQVNLYRVPSHLESYLRSAYRLEDGCKAFGEVALESRFTSQKDRQFHSICSQLGVLPLDDTGMKQSSSRIFHKATSQSHLLRSYSLLHAKVGLASDYSKKPNVLRLRLENEQFLLQFHLTRDLIDWHLGLSVGQDVSPDIQAREVPKYRTVPRRRRGQSCIINSAPFINNMRVKRARSSSMPNTSGRLRTKFHDVKQRIRSNSTMDRTTSNVNMDESWNSETIMEVQQCIVAPVNETEGVPKIEDRNVHVFEDDSEDIRNMSDLHRSDDDDEGDDDDDDDEEEDIDDIEGRNAGSIGTYGNIGHGEGHGHVATDDSGSSNSATRFTPVERLSSTIGLQVLESKVSNVTQKTESERRFLRNCVKCIKPLCFDEPWTNKTLVKATSASTVTMRDSNPCHVDSAVQHRETRPGYISETKSSFRSRRGLSFTRNASDNCEVSAACTPSHKLREYVVGSHLLVPKES